MIARTNKILATPLAKRMVAEMGIKLADIKPADGFVIRNADIKAIKYLESDIKATPLAKEIAVQNGIALKSVEGSGFGGKIRKQDVTKKMLSHNHASIKESQFIELTAMRRIIAKRMSESHAQVPSVTLNAQADVTVLAELRDQANGHFDGRTKISFNDMVVRACAIALKEFPYINACYNEDGILLKTDINIGIAVSLDDGLIVPVLKNADKYSLKEMSVNIKELAYKARAGSLLPQDYSNGTFTVSNLGMFGITSFTPIINQPEACILGVCAIENRLVSKAGQIDNRKFMGFSLTFDHRCVDGASVAKFLQRIIQLIESPLTLFM